MNEVLTILPMPEQVTAAIIDALGTITAALLASNYLAHIFKKSTYFTHYAAKTHNAGYLLRKAKSNIYFIAACGNKFLFKYRKILESSMRNGRTINFLLLDKNNYSMLEQYINGRNYPDWKALIDSLNILIELKNTYTDKINIRILNGLLTASYIGIDIDEEYKSNGEIQIMIYQYNTHTKDSLITRIQRKRNKKEYENVANNILDIWDMGNEVTICDLVSYLDQIQSIIGVL